MVTFLDRDVYTRFKSGETLAALGDEFHAQIDEIAPRPVVPAADQADRAAAPAPGLTAGALQPESPAPVGSSAFPPVSPPAVSGIPPDSGAGSASGAEWPAPAPLPAPDAPLPTNYGPLPPPPAPNAPLGTDWLNIANAQRGKPYIWGSAGGRSDFSTNAPGFDCSGFVSYVYKNAFGINLPAQTASAYAATKPITQADAKPGDIVEFNMDSNDPHQQHIGIYLGDGKVIQAGGLRSDVNIGRVDQFGPGTFEFRRAAGAPTATANATAIDKVSSTVDSAAAHPPGTTVSNPDSPVKTSQNPLETMAADFHKKIDDLSQTAGQAKDTAGSALQQMADDFHRKIDGLLSNNGPGLQSATGEPASMSQSTVDAGRSALAGLVPRVSQSGSGLQPAEGGFPAPTAGSPEAVKRPALYDVNDVRSQVFPSILDPNHPASIMADLEVKYPGKVPGVLNTAAMTPEDRQRYDSLALSVGGVEMGSADVKRFYHGTGSDFAAPTAAKFDPNGLFGPGYYLTDSPEVAGAGLNEFGQVTGKGYAIKRGTGTIFTEDNRVLADNGADLARKIDETKAQLARYGQYGSGVTPQYKRVLEQNLAEYEAAAQSAVGPNVRAVDVPQGLRLLDVESPAPGAIEAIGQVLGDTLAGRAFVRGARSAQGAASAPTGNDVYRTLYTVLQDRGNLASGGWDAGAVKAATNDVLRQAGYDGIQYAGGKRIPMTGTDGNPIEHTAVNIFPSSLDKLRNAISGTQGGAIAPRFATTIGGAAAGGGSAYATTDPNDPNRWAKVGAATLGGGVLGYAGGAALERGVPGKALAELLAPIKNTPAAVQTAVRNFADVAGPQSRAARVDAENLAMRVRQVLGKDDNNPALISQFEKTGEFYANPTPEQAAIASDLRDFFASTGAAGRAGGYISGDVTAAAGGPKQYFPHLYSDQATAVRQSAGSGSYSAKDFYSKSRVYPTIDEAIAAGKTPAAVSEAVQTYGEHALTSEAKVQLARDLAAAGPDVTRPLAQGARPDDGFVSGLSIDPVFNGQQIARTTATVLNNIINSSGLRQFAAVRGPMNALATAKETLFSLSLFHLSTESWNALNANGVRGPAVLWNAIKNAAWKPSYTAFRQSNASLFSKAANDGVTGLAGAAYDVEQHLTGAQGAAVRGIIGGASAGASGYESAKLEGASDEDAFKRGLLYGAAGAVLTPVLGPKMADALWERAVPTMKVLTYKVATEAGGVPGKAAANAVNNTFGGQNLTAIARSKGVQDALRLTMLAPDWWESTAKQVGNLAAPTATGGMTRKFAVRTAITGAAVLEGLNYALNGHFTDQNQEGHRFQVEIPSNAKDARGLGDRQYLSVLPGNIESLLKSSETRDLGQFVKSRESLPVSLAHDLVTNKNYRGQDIVPSGTPPERAIGPIVAQAVSRIAPIGPSNFDIATSRGVAPPLAAFASVSGLRLSHETGTSELLNQREKLVMQTLPGIESDVRALPSFKAAVPARQQNMLDEARTKLTDTLNVQLGIPATDTGLPNKYIGQTDRVLERRIDAAIAKSNAWQADPRTKPRPTAEEQALARRWDGRINPAYTRAQRTQGGVNTEVGNVVNRRTAPLPARP